MWLSGFTLVLLFFLMPETSSANILYRRTRRLRKQTGNDKLRCEPELIGETMTGKELALMVLVRPFTLSFMEPICFFLNVYIALVYALIYMWFERYVQSGPLHPHRASLSFFSLSQYPTPLMQSHPASPSSS
jgi:MFS transporter, DHA1 family, multidrug resistance protein